MSKRLSHFYRSHHFFFTHPRKFIPRTPKSHIYGLEAIAVVGAVVGAVYLYRRWRKAERDARKKNFIEDRVYLVSFARSSKSAGVINLSPFTLKVETWLRINNIDYEYVVDSHRRSERGQLPLVELNGREIADSSIIIEELEKHFGKRLDEDLSEVQRGIARAYEQMLEHSLAWTCAFHRYVENPTTLWGILLDGVPDGWLKTFLNITSRFFVHFMRKMVKQRLLAQGYGRCPSAEIYEIGNADLKAISVYLGDQKYFMGEAPSKVDCWMFGMLSQVVYLNMEMPQKTFVQKECSNIVKYMDRIRTTYFPDWDGLFINPVKI